MANRAAVLARRNEVQDRLGGRLGDRLVDLISAYAAPTKKEKLLDMFTSAATREYVFRDRVGHQIKLYVPRCSIHGFYLIYVDDVSLGTTSFDWLWQGIQYHLFTSHIAAIRMRFVGSFEGQVMELIDRY